MVNIFEGESLSLNIFMRLKVYKSKTARTIMLHMVGNALDWHHISAKDMGVFTKSLWTHMLGASSKGLALLQHVT